MDLDRSQLANTVGTVDGLFLDIGIPSDSRVSVTAYRRYETPIAQRESVSTCLYLRRTA